ncbi:hypothetical protein H072_6370 [Dactylellina haptotyla CBS 200.50]|uniref:Uncharacterized protein n=1 Tax=Dactylellina haptotyla (strain CBS 200.50) TaxID=1284197 RepID=S8AF65_DACHA|nr:hypothetical protein H072_6370 [Dactylellina haptotyla CBS 200.50]
MNLAKTFRRMIFALLDTLNEEAPLQLLYPPFKLYSDIMDKFSTPGPDKEVFLPGQRVNLMSLPNELFLFHIIPYLPFDCVKKFSRCSKHCRALSAPTLFRAGTFDEMYKMFKPDGLLGEYAQFVKDLKFNFTYGKIRTKNPNLLLPARKFMQYTPLFPRLTTLHISLSGARSLEPNLFFAFFTNLSALPCYQHLKHLSLSSWDLTSIPPIDDDEDNSPTSLIGPASPPLTASTLLTMLGTTLPLPLSLSSAKISTRDIITHESIWYRFLSLLPHLTTLHLEFFFLPQEYKPTVLSSDKPRPILDFLTTTHQDIIITTAGVTAPGTPPTALIFIFPNITHLTVKLDDYPFEDSLYLLTRHFPGITHLTIIHNDICYCAPFTSHSLLEECYSVVTRFTRLQKLTCPFPRVMKGGMGIIEPERYTAWRTGKGQCVHTEKLGIDEVGGWVEGWAAVLPELKEVEMGGVGG